MKWRVEFRAVIHGNAEDEWAPLHDHMDTGKVQRFNFPGALVEVQRQRQVDQQQQIGDWVYAYRVLPWSDEDDRRAVYL